ncbi:cystine transport system substrate-binding protein [Deinobacterium chartae]|uniref:Cystine transport system substrate-binding protein n=1 Tax=Deinobacterium chartae TaxID=521158 RepID=A0A841I3P1_9DEIO|nr:transporter substrate-binding domain-containing protein [Deinobacterium chartae]MBB6098632.1 cystine transport system substrate-binding protein [Deinobacterium chartae]
MLRTLTLLGTLALLLGACSNSNDLLDRVKQSGTLKIGLEGTYPPFNYRDPSGELTGFDVDIARAIAEKMNVKAEFVTGDFSGLIAGLQAGQYDVVVNQIAITPERQENLDFSEPYVVSSPQLIQRRDDTQEYASLEDLQGKRLGVGEGSNYAQMAEEVGGIQTRTYPAASETLADLAAGRIDAALNDSLLVAYLIKETTLPVRPGAQVGEVIEMGIPFQKNNPKFKEAIDDALEAIKNDGTYQRISDKWFGVDVSKAPSERGE